MDQKASKRQGRAGEDVWSLEQTTAVLLDAALRKQIESIAAKYPEKQAATLPALHAINDRLGFVPMQAVVELAAMLGLAPAQVQDTLSFYGFFKQDRPMGKYRIQVCRSIICSAWESEQLLDYLCQKLGIQPGETTPDGRVTVEVAECLGVCDGAPAMMVNDTVYGNLTREMIDELIPSLT